MMKHRRDQSSCTGKSGTPHLQPPHEQGPFIVDFGQTCAVQAPGSSQLLRLPWPQRQLAGHHTPDLRLNALMLLHRQMYGGKGSKELNWSVTINGWQTHLMLLQ